MIGHVNSNISKSIVVQFHVPIPADGEASGAGASARLLSKVSCDNGNC